MVLGTYAIVIIMIIYEIIFTSAIHKMITTRVFYTFMEMFNQLNIFAERLMHLRKTNLL